jgi:ketosteroid isomerase-like protein
MDVREGVQKVIEGIREGRILETYEEFYDENVVMSENGEHERVGKAVNRAYEKTFVRRAELHRAQVGTVLVEGDHAAIEWTFDWTPQGGGRRRFRQVALQTWKDGRIVREDFYHS